MTFDVRDLFRGSTVVARRDFLANVHSVKFVVLSCLMLLIMIGAALGISGFAPTGPGLENEYVLWASAAYPTSGPPEILVFVSDVFGAPHAGLSVELGEPFNISSPQQTFAVRTSAATNATGWVAFSNLTAGSWPLRVRVGSAEITGSADLTVRPPWNVTVTVRQFNVVGDYAFSDVSLHAMLLAGVPASRADVRINGTLVGATNENGFFHARLDPGLWNLTVDYRGELASPIPPVQVREPTAVLPFLSGPDFVLYFVAFALMGLFAPIVAIALSYDALTKERLQGSLELLLVRPASRTGLAVGKFLGTFLSVGLPVAGVAVGAIAGIAAVTGKWPDLPFDVAFLLGTLALIATYVLIMQIFSTIARSPGTAILSAILVWFVFNLLWNLVFVLISAAFGIEGGTPAAFTLSTITLLFNPTGVYQLTLSAFFPPTLAAAIGGYQLPDWTGPLAFVVWIAVLLVIAVIAFRKKVV
jgi:ABC-type transport system involved in multi-copper enzyme maturation permease subunit